MKQKGSEYMEVTFKAARVNAGMTQQHVAKILGVNKNTISNYERYITSPDIDTARKLAEIYGCTVNDLKYRKDA